MSENASATLVEISRELREIDGVTVTVRENARTAPRKETRTETEQDTRVVNKGGTMTTETVEREVERTVTVGEKKVVDDRWLEVKVGSRDVLSAVRDVCGDAEIETTDVSGERYKYEIRT